MYTVFGSIIMGMTYTNFGLTVRQKCMVLPCILLFYACVRTQKILNIKAIRIEKTNKTTGFSKKYAHTLQA
jgi:hypothetical protein